MSNPLNLVPNIESTALPSTPASEWADSTNGVLAAHVTSTPLDPPGPDVPGAFPGFDAEAPATNSEETMVDTAKAYLPAEADVQRAITNAGQTAKAYLPQGVAAYLPTSGSTPVSDSSDYLRPTFPTEVSGMTNSSTRAQAGSAPHLPSSVSYVSTFTRGDSDLGSITNGSNTPSQFPENLDTPPSLGLPQVSSPKPLTPSGPTDFVASGSEAGDPVSRQSTSDTYSSQTQSEGVPAPHNSLVTPDEAYSDRDGVNTVLPTLTENDFIKSSSSVAVGQGSTALNSSAFKDNYPTGDVPEPTSSQVIAALDSHAPFKDTSDALAPSNPNATNPTTTHGSSAPKDNISSGEPTFSIQNMNYSAPEDTLPAHNSTSTPVDTSITSTGGIAHTTTGSGDYEDGEEQGDGAAAKKSKLARLKAKMHVGQSA